MEFPHFLRHTVHTFGFDDTDSKASEAADVFRAMTGSYPATVLIEIPIDDIMTAILDAPVAPVCLEQLLGVGLLWRAAGDTVGELDGAFPGFFLNALAFNHKGLSNVWKVKIVVQCAGGPNFPGLDTPVLERGAHHEVRFLSMLEIESHVLQEVGLVAFDGEVVMRLPVLDQIRGELALGQQRIGGDVLALDVDGIQQGGRHLDLIGTFDLLITV